MMSRVERWERHGRTALVEVAEDETVMVSVELFAQMMTNLGYHHLDTHVISLSRRLAILRHEAATPIREHDEDGECCRQAAKAAPARQVFDGFINGDGAGA